MPISRWSATVLAQHWLMSCRRSGHGWFCSCLAIAAMTAAIECLTKVLRGGGGPPGCVSDAGGGRAVTAPRTWGPTRRAGAAWP